MKVEISEAERRLLVLLATFFIVWSLRSDLREFLEAFYDSYGETRATHVDSPQGRD